MYGFASPHAPEARSTALSFTATSGFGTKAADVPPFENNLGALFKSLYNPDFATSAKSTRGIYSPLGWIPKASRELSPELIVTPFIDGLPVSSA